MARHPYMPLYFGDFLASTADWTGQEQSLYLLLLAYQWSIGSLPGDLTSVQLMSKWHPKSFRSAWEKVSTKFELKDGRYINARLEEHRQKAVDIGNSRSDAGKRGAQSRWQKDGKDMANAMANPLANEMPSNPNQTNLRGGLRSSSSLSLTSSPSVGGGAGDKTIEKNTGTGSPVKLPDLRYPR